MNTLWNRPHKASNWNKLLIHTTVLVNFKVTERSKTKKPSTYCMVPFIQNYGKCLENPMDRGAWRAMVHGSQRVGHDGNDLARMQA